MITQTLYPLARKILFSFDPETAHRVALTGLDFSRVLPWQKAASSPQEVMGITFPNPVGLAAGLDKNGAHLKGLSALGFGFIEVGTITPRPQPGNPKPRIFRIPAANALINRMGFNNNGVDELIRNIEKAHFDGVLGINIGKNFDTPVERAADDYLICLDKIYSHASYITVNISSPNTPGLRELQQETQLDALLGAIKQRQTELAEKHGQYTPVMVKIAPDLNQAGLESIASTLVKHRMDGVIATNTTLSRASVEGIKHGDETGGLSGAPLTQRSTDVVRKLSGLLDGALPIIAAGGIMCGQDAADKIAAGASLVQIYSGFIYQGPGLIREAAESIRKLNIQSNSNSRAI